MDPIQEMKDARACRKGKHPTVYMVLASRIHTGWRCFCGEKEHPVPTTRKDYIE